MDNLAEIKTDAKQFLAEKFALSKLIGNDHLFVEAIRRAVKIAQISAPVLLLGETGTGKELFARAIHHLSSRSNEPYIAVNCAAIPFELFENELFGHVKGAYTDARQQQKGYIAEAEGGTLFLDEINSLHPTVQVKQACQSRCANHCSFKYEFTESKCEYRFSKGFVVSTRCFFYQDSSIERSQK